MGHPSTATERAAVVTRALDEIERNRHLLLLGAHGSGVTFVGTAISLRLAENNRPVVGLHPSTIGDGFRATPAEWEPHPDTRRELPVNSETLSERLRAGDHPILWVDDAQRLTEAQADWLCMIAKTTETLIVFGVVTDADADQHIIDRLTALWHDGRAARFDLEPIGHDDAMALIARRLGDRQIDSATRLAIYHAGGGLPGLMGEMAESVAVTGPSAGELGSFTYPLVSTVSTSMLDRGRHRLKSLTDADRDSLHVLAKVDGLPYARAAAYVGGSTVARLLAGGFLRRDGDTISQAHRIEAESVLRLGGGSDYTRLRHRVAESVFLDHRSGIALDPLEYLFAAETAAEEPTVTGASNASDIAYVFAMAAAKASAMGLHYASLDLARRSLAHHPTVNAAVDASRALSALGNDSAARVALTEADGLRPTRRSALAIEVWRIELLVRLGALETETVREWPTFMPGDTEKLDALRVASMHLASTDWPSAAEVALPMTDDSDEDALVVTMEALSILLTSQVQIGGEKEIRETLELGRSLLPRLARTTTAAERMRSDRMLGSWLANRVAAQSVAGVDTAELPRELEEAMDAAYREQHLDLLALLGGVRGIVALCRGDMELAATELGLAAERIAAYPAWRWPMVFAGFHTTALLYLDRVVEARSVRDALAASGLRPTAFRELMVRWQDDALARSDAAAPEMPAVDIPRDPGSGTPLDRLAMMFFSVAAGADAAGLVDEAADIRRSVDLPLIRGLADFVIGVARSDAATVDIAAESLARAGYLGFAETAATRAVILHSGHGDRSRASASRAFAQSVRSDGPRPADRPDPEFTQLTSREIEVVELVRDGKSNRAIAAALFVSVRTVESHIYQARLKLGMSRSELVRSAPARRSA